MTSRVGLGCSSSMGGVGRPFIGCQAALLSCLPACQSDGLQKKKKKKKNILSCTYPDAIPNFSCIFYCQADGLTFSS